MKNTVIYCSGILEFHNQEIDNYRAEFILNDRKWETIVSILLTFY